MESMKRRTFLGSSITAAGALLLGADTVRSDAVRRYSEMPLRAHYKRVRGGFGSKTRMSSK